MRPVGFPLLASDALQGHDRFVPSLRDAFIGSLQQDQTDKGAIRGTWAMVQGERVPVVYFSSYGDASRFAADFTAALAAVAAFPGYGRDMLVAAHKGDEVLGRVPGHYEATVEPDSARVRDELCDLPGSTHGPRPVCW